MRVFVDGGGNREGNCYYGLAFYNSKGLIWKTGDILENCRTNNEAEYDALYTALLSLRINPDLLDNEDIIIYMDSELVVKQVLEEYVVKAMNLTWRCNVVNRSLKMLRAQVHPRRVILKHIPREENEEADKAGRKALEIRTSEDWGSLSPIEKGMSDLIRG